MYRKSHKGFQMVVINLTLGDLDRSNQDHMVFKWPYLPNKACWTDHYYYKCIESRTRAFKWWCLISGDFERSN